jgi:PAS domain S-box-containing protein
MWETGELFRLMVEQVKDYAIFMLDPMGRVSSWNAGAERIKGYRAEEIIRKHFSVFYTKEDIKSGTPERELEIARSLGRVDVEGWRLRKDGTRFWAAVTITALVDKEGNLLGFGKVTRDVTERRNVEETLQKSRKMFERLFENAPDAVVVVDRQGVIRKVNQQTEVLFGYMREEMVGHHVEYLIPERFHKLHRQHRRNYFADPRPRRMGVGLELYGRNREGQEIPVDIMLSPIESEEGIWSFAVIRDITQQKRNESLINELNTTLKNQVQQLAVTNRELEAFSYSVSHDLRAPLRHITGFVELLNKRDLSSLDEKGRHYLAVITQAAQKMGVLIDDLLAFSRMGRTDLMKTNVDLGKMITEILNELSEETKGRDIDWKIAPLPEVIGDSAMLHQVMANLIANALKFTRPRTPAMIEIGAQVDHPNETLIYVKDNGVGFDAKYVDKLFGLFQRLHSTEEFEGTGVGLANVQRILLRHGGRAWAEGKVDEGATFWFSLPKTKEV